MQTYAIRPSAIVIDPPLGRQYVLTIHDLPSEDKPRERLISEGPEALSIKELMAIVLMTGTTKEDVLEMSDRIIREYGERAILSERDPQRLSQESEIPIVKACQIVAVGELGRRFFDKSQNGLPTIRNAKEAHEYLVDMRSLSKEHLRGLYLNSRNKVIRDEVISIGTVDSNIIHPREVFRPGIEYNAAAVILAHNHPSGDTTPSDEDRKVTEQLIEAGRIVGIEVLDHIIITKDSFASIEANYR
ncbi:MAG: DNA repair protein RadC [Patescibacteria group bacterium]|nr:DNA repair protein RadC [Patescibacteria group bacterium]